MTKPHAVTSRTAGGQTTAYSYDARGRQIAGGGREVVWRPFDLPEAIHQGGAVTRFAYDAFGTRVRKQRLSGAGGGAGSVMEETLILGGLYERRWSAAAPNKAEHVYYVQGSEGPVAQVVYEESANAGGAKEKTLYLQQETLGSVGLVTDSAGNEVERSYFEPFGGKVEASGKAAASPLLGEVKLGFTGHHHDDDLGLINMIGRVYDPLQKRFLTPDPFIPQPLSGQSYNRYSYVVNNPLRYTDPTGYQQVPAGSGSSGAVTGGDSDVVRPPPIMVTATPPGVPVSTEGQTTPPTGPVTPPAPPPTPAAAPAPPPTIPNTGGWGFLKSLAWGAAKQLVLSAPPVAAVRQIHHNLRVAAAAVHHAAEGDWDLAGAAILELPQQNAEAAGSLLTGPIEAALALPDTIGTAMNADDPEEQGAAAVQAVQQVATVVAAVVGVAKGVKGPPSPNGRKGGAAHQAKVAEVKADIKSRNLDVGTEDRVKTPGGSKPNRFVDVVGKKGNEVVEMHQVGRQTKSGQPVAREIRALDDIQRAKGTRPKFHPYN